MQDQAGDWAVRDSLVRRGLKLRHLRLLVALQETRQVSAAATALNMSQPVASRLLAEIERIVGAPLYDRHPRGVSLLPAGARLAERARNMLAELDVAGRELVELREGARGAVRIGAVTGPALEIVLPTLRRLRSTHPNIDAQIAVERSPALIGELAAGRLDFVIGRLTSDDKASDFETIPIGEEAAGLMVRQDHPLAGAADATITDCVAYEWVMQPPEGLITQVVARYLEERGVPPPRRVTRTSSLLMTLALVSQTDAIAPVARSVIDHCGGDSRLAGRVALLPLALDLSVSVYSLLRIKGRALPPAAGVVFEMIVERARALNDVVGSQADPGR